MWWSTGSGGGKRLLAPVAADSSFGKRSPTLFASAVQIPVSTLHGRKHSAGMRSRTRSVCENMRFTAVEKRPEDFFHGLLA